MTTILYAICSVVAGLWTLIAFSVWRGLHQIRQLQPKPNAPAPQLKVSAILPARNEERELANSVRSLLAQTHVDLEIIVVNDHSTDGTAAIADRLAAEEPRVQVLHNPPLQPGWLGKVNAMHHGAALASGELLLFSDADILHKPGCLAAAIAELVEGEYDLLSVLPRFIFRSVFENALATTFFLAVPIFAKPGLEDANSDVAMAAGAFMLLRRQVYAEIGGHSQLYNSVVDDIMLGRIVKRSGHRVTIRTGPSCLQCRMFIGNRQAFWGMTKNVLDSFEGSTLLTFLVIWPWVLLFSTGSLTAIAGLVMGDHALCAVGILLHLYKYTTFFITRIMYQFDPLKLLLFPLGAVSMLASIHRAAYLRYVRGQVVWRGRKIRVSPPK